MSSLETPLLIESLSVPHATVDRVARRPLPALQPLHPTPWSKRHRTPVVFLVLLLVIGGILTVSLKPRSPAPSPIPSDLQNGGRIVAARTVGGGELLVSVPRRAVVYLHMAGKQLLTLDGRPLGLSSVRAGDAMAMRSATVVVDTSQAWTSIEGVVASGPDPDGDEMTVQLDRGRTILVNIGSRTRIDGRAPSMTSRMSIQDAEKVRVTGVLDRTLDEVTETRSIELLHHGPLTHGPTHGFGR
jgi:hypothetical protein